MVCRQPGNKRGNTDESVPTTSLVHSISLTLDSLELANPYERVSTRQFDHGKVLIAALAPRPGERGLDVGCGTGRLGDYVLPHAAGATEPAACEGPSASADGPLRQSDGSRAEDGGRVADEIVAEPVLTSA